MRNKIVGILFLGVTVLLLAGCGADNVVKTVVNPNGSGGRTLIIQVSQSDLQSSSVTPQQLATVLQKAMPSGLKMSDDLTSDPATYSFYYNFKNMNDLAKEAAVILGYKPKIQFSQSGSPLAQTYNFDEQSDPTQYFSWATNAVNNAGLFQNQGGNLVNSTTFEADLPGQSANGNQQGVSGSGDYSFSSTKAIPVGLGVKTSIGWLWGANEKISMFVSAKDATGIPKGVMSAFFKKSGVGLKKINQKYTVEYVTTLSAGSPQALDKKLQKLLGNGSSLSYAKAAGSFFSPQYSFQQTLNLTPWLGQLDLIGPSSSDFTLATPGQILNFDGMPVNSATKMDKVSMNGQETVQASATVQETNPLRYALLGLFVLALAGGSFLSDAPEQVCGC